ncbi:hypothetical protein BGZ73_004548 [Actinomortierella ambigua]|nr:hypothetical protein BGZ73_004548 [Actinomortierella ambigua]
MDTTTRTVATSAVVVMAAILVVHTITLLRSTTPSSTKHPRRTKRKKGPDQVKAYVPGLVNSGNTCFLNSTLQAMAALPSLQLYLETRKELNGHEQDSTTLALCETIECMGTLLPTTRRLTRLITTLKKKASHVLTSRQEDAQELFQILSSQLSEERDKVDNPTTSSLLDRATIQSMAAGEPQHPRSRRQSVSSTMLGSCLSSSWHSSSSTTPLTGSTATLNPSHNIGGALSVPGSPESQINPAMTASFILDQTEQAKYQRAKSPFMGLLASRVSCVDCGYTAAIRHSTFDNLSLTIPMRYSCTIEECLDDFVHLDTIHDFNCRKCTVVNALEEVNQIIDNTQRRLVALETSSNGSSQVSSNGKQGSSSDSSTSTDSKDKSTSTSMQRRSSGTAKLDESRIRANLEQALQWRAKIQECLQHNIEMDLTPIELTPVRSKRTTKHSMIAKPPQALCLHLNRSTFTPVGTIAKNPCRVRFKRTLDFTPFTTSGYLTTEPTRSMSQRTKSTSASMSTVRPTVLRDTHLLPTGLPSVSLQPEAPWSGSAQESRSNSSSRINSNYKEDRVRYRLEAVLMHLGSHNSGHFVTFRRVPEGRVLHEHRRRQMVVEEEDEEEKETEKEKGEMKENTTPLAPSPSSVADGAASGGRLQGSAIGNSVNGVQEEVEEDDDDEKHLNERWWRISDEHVQLETWATVRHAEAYMLFYEKLTD